MATSEAVAAFSGPSFNISLQPMSPSAFSFNTSSPLSTSTSLPSSPRSKTLSVLVPSSSSSLSSLLSTALPTLPTHLTDPSQLRLFHPHHYFGRTVDRLTAHLYSEPRPRRFHTASLHTARQMGVSCLHCGLNPQSTGTALGGAQTPPR